MRNACRTLNRLGANKLPEVKIGGNLLWPGRNEKGKGRTATLFIASHVRPLHTRLLPGRCPSYLVIRLKNANRAAQDGGIAKCPRGRKNDFLSGTISHYVVEGLSVLPANRSSQNPPVKLAHGNRTTTTHPRPHSLPTPPPPKDPSPGSLLPPLPSFHSCRKAQSETGFFHICGEKTAEGCTQKRPPRPPLKKKRCGGGGG